MDESPLSFDATISINPPNFHFLCFSTVLLIDRLYFSTFSELHLDIVKIELYYNNTVHTKNINYTPDICQAIPYLICKRGNYLMMFHYLFFVMSLSGSLVVLLYGLMYPIAQRYFPHFWRRKLLCLSLFFYLVPLSLLKELKPPILNWLKADISSQYEKVRIDPKYAINVQNDQFMLGPGLVIVYIVSLCIAVIAFILIIKQLKQYGMIRRTYLSKSFCETPPPQLERMFQQTKEELQVKKPVKLICSRLCDAPVTIGVFKPAIVFPASEKLCLGSNDTRCILKHELLHIKNRDLLLKFFYLSGWNQGGRPVKNSSRGVQRCAWIFNSDGF